MGKYETKRTTTKQVNTWGSITFVRAGGAGAGGGGTTWNETSKC